MQTVPVGQSAASTVRHAQPRARPPPSTGSPTELRRAVFDGELESGTPLREVALAESLGVSRPTVREALGVLVAEGLATREPNRGVARRRPRPGLGPRRLPRPAACSRWPASGAGPRRPRRPRDAVRAALAGLRRRWSTATPYQRAQPSAHLAIHLRLVGLTGSPRLVAMAASLHRRAPARARPGRPGPPQRRATRPHSHQRPARAARGRRRRRGRGRARRATSTGPRTSILERARTRPDPSLPSPPTTRCAPCGS